MLFSLQLLEAALEGRMKPVKEFVAYGVNIECSSLKEKDYGQCFFLFVMYKISYIYFGMTLIL